MTRILFACIVLLALAGFRLLSGKNQLASQEVVQSKPGSYNVLFIAVDDLRPELGCYGARHIKSPNIDRLAAEGMVFQRAYCQQAVCSPSRTSLLTGLRPDSTRVYDLETHFRKTIPNVVTLPQHFKENGYYTAAMGKIYHGNLNDTLSWSEPWWRPQSKRKAPRGYVSAENVTLDTAKNSRGYAFESADEPDSIYQDGMTADRAIQTLRRIKDKPFFLAVGFLKPHLPFVAPKKYWDLYDPATIKVPPVQEPQAISPYALARFGELRAYTGIPKKGLLTEAQSRQLIHGYYACVSYMDAQVGRVLDELKKQGLDKNTIVILWGDHGWKLGEYGEWCKHTNFEVDAKAALLVKAPQMKAKGKPTKNLVEFVDIYPTLCELAGLKKPSHLQGISFAPLLDNPTAKGKAAVYSQYPRKMVMGYTVKTDRYRLVRWQLRSNPDSVAAYDLFDHVKDPGEMRNVAAEPAYQSVREELDQLLVKNIRTWSKSARSLPNGKSKSPVK